MGKVWSSKNRRDEQDFLSWLDLGKTVYVIQTPQYGGKSARWNHARFWESHTVIGTHWILGGWVIDDANQSAAGFLAWHGTVYEDRPADVPHWSDPKGDAGLARPWPSESRSLHELELRLYPDRAKAAAKQGDGNVKAGRRRWF